MASLANDKAVGIAIPAAIAEKLSSVYGSQWQFILLSFYEFIFHFFSPLNFLYKSIRYEKIFLIYCKDYVKC